MEHPLHRRRRDRDILLDQRQVFLDAPDGVDELLAHHQGDGVGVVDDVGDLVRVEPEVQGDGHAPDLAEGEVALQVLVAVQHEERDLVTLPNPHVLEGVGQAVDPAVELPIGEAGIAEDDRLLVGELAGVSGYQLPQKQPPGELFLDRLPGYHGLCPSPT